MIRAAAAWLLFVGALTAAMGFGVYREGILVHHGHAPSEMLYGWPAVRYLCPWVPAACTAITALAAAVVWLLDGRR